MTGARWRNLCVQLPSAVMGVWAFGTVWGWLPFAILFMAGWYTSGEVARETLAAQIKAMALLRAAGGLDSRAAEVIKEAGL